MNTGNVTQYFSGGREGKGGGGGQRSRTPPPPRPRSQHVTQKHKQTSWLIIYERETKKQITNRNKIKLVVKQ